jgi:hypothetical protein
MPYPTSMPSANNTEASLSNNNTQPILTDNNNYSNVVIIQQGITQNLQGKTLVIVDENGYISYPQNNIYYIRNIADGTTHKYSYTINFENDMRDIITVGWFITLIDSPQNAGRYIYTYNYETTMEGRSCKKETIPFIIDSHAPSGTYVFNIDFSAY